MESPIKAMEALLGTTWLNLQNAREKSKSTRADLVKRIEEKRITTSDHSVVVFGSLARDEFTDGSDIDWTLLIDGPANPKVFETVSAVRSILKDDYKDPGPEGQFGRMIFSHDLVHQIGGEDDSNSNTTRRILLLLESISLGDHSAYERVLRCVLQRYLLEDEVFAERSTMYHVPRFLLNDFARYWRTMAVDFAYKSRERQGKGAALRNIKLRMSRKLLFVSGLLSCFSCQLGVVGESKCPERQEACVICLEGLMHRTPLEILAVTILHLEKTGVATDPFLLQAKKTFTAYDEFLAMLSDSNKRDHLNDLPVSEMSGDTIFNEARKVSHDFRDGISSIFFDGPAELVKLTRTYGVF